MDLPYDAFGEVLNLGAIVRIRDGTFAGMSGEVIGYHWRPSYPKVRLIVLGRSAEVWFYHTEVVREGPAPFPSSDS